MLRDVASRAAALARVAWSRSSSLTGSVASTAAASATGSAAQQVRERARERTCVLVGAFRFFSSTFLPPRRTSSLPLAIPSLHSTRPGSPIVAPDGEGSAGRAAETACGFALFPRQNVAFFRLARCCLKSKKTKKNSLSQPLLSSSPYPPTGHAARPRVVREQGRSDEQRDSCLFFVDE